MIYASFEDWVNNEVLPLKEKNPNWIRLDGRIIGGNRTVVGRFKYSGCEWVVHGDTRFEPILIAHNAIENHILIDPFIIRQTRVRKCLDLNPKIKLDGQPKYFYIYSF